MRRSRAYAASSASTALPILSRSAKMPDVGRTRTRTARLPTVVVLPGGQPRDEARPQGHGRGDDLVIDHDGASVAAHGVPGPAAGRRCGREQHQAKGCQA